MSDTPPGGPSGLSDAARALLARRASIDSGAASRRTAPAAEAPLASTQLEQWLSSEVSSSGASSALPKLLHLEGQVNRGALRRTLTEIARRHQVLRTVYLHGKHEPVQKVMPHHEVDLREADLRNVPEAERGEAARLLLDQDARRPFDLTRDILMRPLLVQLGDESFEFQVTFHQVSFDGWSNGVYLRELGALYSAYTAGRETPLPDLPLQFADYAIWARTREGTPAFDADRAYWRAQVSGSTSSLDLATDRPRPRDRSHARAVAAATIDPSLTSRLSELALAEGTTLFTAAFAAFQVLAGRRAGRDDFVLGVVSANRTRRETEDLIGSFLTIVPVRTRIGDSGFRSHFRRTAEALAGGFGHRAFPFQRLLPELRAGGDPGADPLYDAVFNYRNMPASLPAMDGLTVTDFRAPHLGTVFDLHLNATPDTGCLMLELEYNPDLFDADTAERWLEGYRALLEAVAADPDAGTAALPVMPARERRQLLAEWSGATVPSPGADFVLDRFERMAEAFPDASAIEHAGAGVSYRELRDRTRRTAARLRDAGVAQGDFVGLCADRSIDTMTALLAILSVGAVYVPLDPRTPARRVDAMMESAGLRLILAEQPGIPALANRTERTIILSDLLAAAAQSDLAGGPAPIGPDDAAYVIFTSGSTGAPKGVAVPHASLARYIAAAIEALDARPGDRVLQFSALTFDVSVQEIFMALGTGATLVLRTEDMLDSPAEFAERCRRLCLTHIWVPTAFWHEITRTEPAEAADLGDTVRVVSFGGEAVTPDSVRRFQAVARGEVRLCNCYGPTEATIFCTWADLVRDEADLGTVPIGRPFPGVTVYVLDGRHQPVPIGVPGELWIGGGNLATGYLRAPELTAARFVPDPFSSAPGARLYRTGDTARWLADGRLAFIGRNDFQIKVRGHRVELLEIERVLRNVPGIRQAAVIAAEDERLVGFVVLENPDRFSVTDIQDAAARELPAYMVPGVIVASDHLPLSATGKLDRQRLRGMVPGATPAGGAPVTRTERMVASIWEETLGVTGVGPDDRFLDLGGHSLLAMRVANRLRYELGITLSIRTLLTHSTLSALARELDRLRPQQAGE